MHLIYLFFFLTLTLYSNELTYLNTLRQKSGLIPFKIQNQLKQSAKKHAKYLIKYQTNSHYEQSKHKRTPSLRAINYGYASKDIMENISINTKNAHESIDTLFSAIYHRFVFLDFSKNEIGIGHDTAYKDKKIHSAFVYDLGSSSLRLLCKQPHNKKNGFFYIKNICKNKNKLIPKKLYFEKEKKLNKKNHPIVLYPYNHAKDISPVFYTEHPHPLPGSLVSGYPISIQFNPAYYQKIQLKSFKLFDENFKEIKKYKILTHKNDTNHRLNTLQFAFMPLERLKYNQTYHVKVSAIANGKYIQKNWEFKTKNILLPFYRIDTNIAHLPLPHEKKFVLYFVPKHNKDTLKQIKHSNTLKVKYLDLNTLEVTILKRKVQSTYHIYSKHKKVYLK